MLSFTLSGNICIMHIHIYSKHITITDIIIFMHSYKELIQLLMLIRISRRSYRTYSYSEVPVGITDQNDIHLFILIHRSGYYHITMGIPRPVIINE